MPYKPMTEKGQLDPNVPIGFTTAMLIAFEQIADFPDTLVDPGSSIIQALLVRRVIVMPAPADTRRCAPVLTLRGRRLAAALLRRRTAA